MNRKVKIVATIGPASQEDAIVEKLLQAGMDVARLNFSHGTHEMHAARISQLRADLDTPGPPSGIVTGSSRSEDPGRCATCTIVIGTRFHGSALSGRRQPTTNH